MNESVAATSAGTALKIVNDAKYVGTTAEEHQGLVNKFPFDVEQKTYPLWDGVMGTTVEAKFAGEEEVDGLSTYKFTVAVQHAPIEVAENTPGRYNDDKTIWVDPVTGAFIDQKEHQTRSLEDGTVALDLTLGFTPETAADIAAARFDYSFSPLALAVTAIVVIAYFYIVIHYSKAEYREVISERFDK